mmetsp:Transcript_98044/g.158102  ORF Transcript_98044/g.158102 Transcript_98044/m.158102 type:complete len:230 (-) Transcript_98044:629-1318(-)
MDLDLETFLVLKKCLVVLAFCREHVPDIGITYTHQGVVVAMPCNGTVQGCLVHAQRLLRLHANFVKENPCLFAHVPNVCEYRTVCASSTLPSINTTTALSNAGPSRRQDAPLACPCCHCASVLSVTTPNEKCRRFVRMKLAQLRRQYSCHRSYQHGPLRFRRELTPQHLLCHGVHFRAACVIDCHKQVLAQQNHGLPFVGAQQVEQNSLCVYHRQLTHRLPCVSRVHLV